MGGGHYLDLRLVGFLSSRSAGEMRFGDGGNSVSMGAWPIGGAKWRKWRIRAMLQNLVKKRKPLRRIPRSYFSCNFRVINWCNFHG